MQEPLQNTGAEFGRLLARPLRPDDLRREVDESLAARRVIALCDIDMAALIAERGADCAVVGLAPVPCPYCGSRDTANRIRTPPHQEKDLAQRRRPRLSARRSEASTHL